MEPFYRIAVVRNGVRRVMDLEASEAKIVAREAEQAGWQVSFVILPAGTELIPGIIEEPANLLAN